MCRRSCAWSVVLVVANCRRSMSRCGSGSSDGGAGLTDSPGVAGAWAVPMTFLGAEHNSNPNVNFLFSTALGHGVKY
ncbi:hypothetical protein EDC01DRAFT_640049 [Geopyxis carbonaria]|nr:hypothetical protein EDC01DRAFT_640049 [Geopyxis carbonaria]